MEAEEAMEAVEAVEEVEEAVELEETEPVGAWDGGGRGLRGGAPASA